MGWNRRQRQWGGWDRRGGKFRDPVLSSFAPGTGILEKALQMGIGRTGPWAGLSAALLRNGKPVPSPLWASMHVGVTGLLVWQDSGSLRVLLSVPDITT